jgi:osmotically-inducible protein OsmY
MKHFIAKSILALGSSGLLVLAQSTTPQTTPSTGAQTAADTQMASKVRTALMNDQTIAPTAHNVHVTAKNGMVMLKGKVSSESEHDAIVSKAKDVAGASNVKDEITVAKK